jgi:hypothetical protein
MLPENVIKNKVSAYLLLKQEIDERKEMQQSLKDDLDFYLAEAETNARGSYVIPFSEMLEVGGTKYKAVQKVRKESKVLNEDRVFEWIETMPEKMAEGWDLVVTTQHIDQDSLWNLFVTDVLDKDTLDSFYDTKVSYSFLPTKE